MDTYPTRRSTVYGEAVVASSSPLAASAALEVLAEGGTAADAAVAAAMCLTVVEPTNNGIGGDLLALVWDGERMHGLNASGRSPQAWSPEHFGQYAEMPKRGWNTVTVPGAVSGWAALSERFGRLDFARLGRDAVRHAEQGWRVGPIVAQDWGRAAGILGEIADFAATVLPGGRAPREGEKVVFADHAVTLREILATGGESFYRGVLAERIVAYAEAGGGLLSAEDLAEHEVDWCEPIAASWGGHELYEIPPNSQGLAALVAIRILERLGVDPAGTGGTERSGADPDDAETVHLQVEAMRQALSVLHGDIADPAWMRVEVQDILSDEVIDALAARISRSRAADVVTEPPLAGGTVYLSVGDADGMMVSLIQSNYYGFGSGVVVPGTGIALHDRGAGFVLTEGHPNQVAGSKRPLNTIIPGLLTRGGVPVCAYGVMGGPMQPQGHLQVMHRLLAGQSVQQALDAPRWFVEGDGELKLEVGWPHEVAAALEAKGHCVTRTGPGDRTYGGGQAVLRLPDGGYAGGSDPRKDGHAAAR
ncbi:gamma-glutamyltransferase family protein [Micrococcus luteus]